MAQDILDRISATYYALTPKISINSETAKREVMIAPVLHAVIQRINATLNIEYPIEINQRLSGTIDYRTSQRARDKKRWRFFKFKWLCPLLAR